MRKNHLNHDRRSVRIFFLSFLCVLTIWVPVTFAQNPAQAARKLQWEGYQLPTGKFNRFIDRQKGFSFRVPADWQQQPGRNNSVAFRHPTENVNVVMLTEEIPDGVGVATYVSSLLQGIRQSPIKPESAIVRRVMSMGLEWREITHEIEPQGGVNLHQTMWFTAYGPRAYGLIFSVNNDQLEKYEPIFKRILSSARISAAGHWNEEYETLRADFTSGSREEAGKENEAESIANALRNASESFTGATNRIAELLGTAPDAALDLITDADPLVRTAVIAALAKSNHPQSAALLIWALSDKDIFASTIAAQTLAARGALPEIKSKLATLAENPPALVRAGVALGEPASRELIEEMLRGENPKEHLAALQLALIMEKFDLPLPFPKLLASPDVGVPVLVASVLERHPQAGAANQLVKLLRTENEIWAVFALAAIAPIGTAQELRKRIDEIDAQFDKLGRAASKKAQGTPPAMSRTQTGQKQTEWSEPIRPSSVAEWKKMPQDARLAFLRGELDVAVRKIKYRDRWNQAKNDDERRQIKSEIDKDDRDLSRWARISLTFTATAPAGAATLDFTKLPNLKDARTTGETLFPKDTFSYAMAPNFAATMEKIDSALAGVQMATVRDQMTFALILKQLKAGLAAKVGAHLTGDVSNATGIDLKSPMAIGSWMAEEIKDGSVTRSALTVRVTDRARFERLLATYQDGFGDLGTFFPVTAALARFGGVIPAAAPMIFAALASDEKSGAVSRRIRLSPESKIPSLKPFTHMRRENLGAQPISSLVRPVINLSGRLDWERIYITYLGETAVVSPSRDAIADLISSGISGETIAGSEALTKTRSVEGEIVFFSRPEVILKSLIEHTEINDEKDRFAAFIKAFGVESGALQLTQKTWETVFKIGLSGNDFTRSFRPFKIDELAAPRELFPRSTILYAGTIVDPGKMFSAMMSLETEKDREKASVRSKEISADIEKLIVPNMQGEIAAALLSLAPIYKGGTLPALALAVKLKNGELASAFRDGKLFANFRRLPETKALGSPVVELGEEGGAPYVAVTGDYILLVDSVETLQLFETKEKFSTSRDFSRLAKEMPGELAIFATYNLESAFDEASKVLESSSFQNMVPILSAVIHAFHSQRAYLAVEKDGLVGRLTVAFDREGRYSVGDLANSTGEFDLANAMIAPKGLSVFMSPRVESMTLRVKATRPGIAPRLRDDLARFNFQRVESSDDSTVVVTTSARRIPEKLTISLPVARPEFAPFLNPTTRINSKDPTVVALAQQIAGNDKDGRGVARKIGEWTYGNLKWKKVESDTVETLASREADCLEHSELYVALARALGLPARIVTGAALSGGSFGSHAWVEIYLGEWVELDPTWGLMEHVDATHLRFEGLAFHSYAMLNQLEVEIATVRRTVADFQRDPIRLVKEFSLEPGTRELAFDLSLTAEHVLGRERWAGLDEKQRALVISAFEKTTKKVCQEWEGYDSRPHVLQSEVNPESATLRLLVDDNLLRVTLARRDGAWFITEHENSADSLAEFADALEGALHPANRRGYVYETSFEKAVEHLEKLIAREGEKPELFLIKSRVLHIQEINASFIAAQKVEAQSENKPSETGKTEPGKNAIAKDEPKSDPSLELLKVMTRRWPDFAPGRMELAQRLFLSLKTADPLSKDAENLLAELKAYARLVPYDPRPWSDMANAHEHFNKLDDAEAAYEKAIALAPEYLEYHTALVNLHLNNNHPEKAKAVFARMLKAAPEIDEIFEQFVDYEGYQADYAQALEILLLSFPKELEGREAGWSLLADLQEAQDKLDAAIKSIQHVIAINPGVDSYLSLSRLYRSQQKFTLALNAANQALKLDESSVDAHFERACSLARLARKREALAALKKMFEIEPDTVFDTDEADLQPLSTMPEFKAIIEKIKKALETPK